jgi:hypothetical protein
MIIAVVGFISLGLYVAFVYGGVLVGLFITFMVLGVSGSIISDL